MSNISNNNASAALRVLTDTAIERENQLSVFENAPDVESDDENDSSLPVFDAFYQSGGSRSIASMPQT